jgi:DNA-directed RNA polymerase specialized sigma24 family protein
MDLDAYSRLRTEARRHARRAADVDDLVQDALLIALEQGREDDAAWLAGVIRNQATMQARTAIRRQRREAAVAEDNITTVREEMAPSAAALLGRLPPAARRVAVLALHGLNAEEIRWILSVSAAAFRQRLTSIRKALGALPPTQRAEAMALAYVRDPARSVELQFGLIRRALKAALGGADGIATHDADGHLIVVRTLMRSDAHTSTGGGNE